MYNRIILIGRVTAAPEMRFTQSGKQVVSFSLAVNRPRKASGMSSGEQQQDVDFINIVAWQNLAEICSKYLEKGKLVCVEGRLQIRNYTGNDGVKRKACEVVASDMRMLSPRGASGDSMTSYEMNDSSMAVMDREKEFDGMGASDFGMEDDLPF